MCKHGQWTILFEHESTKHGDIIFERAKYLSAFILFVYKRFMMFESIELGYSLVWSMVCLCEKEINKNIIYLLIV